MPAFASATSAPPAVAAPDAEHILTNPFLCDDTDGVGGEPFTLLVLNYFLPECTLNLWPKASYRICADGGANRLYDYVRKVVADPEARAAYLPDLITGDLDSLRREVRSAYEGAGIKVVANPDQDSTDLQKSLEFARGQLHLGPPLPSGHRPTVVAVGALGGRLDHTVANLAILGRYPELRVVLVGDGNVAQLVPPGRSTIRPVRGIEGPTCGLVPLFSPATVTTRGLRWDVCAARMEMTGLVSTSNEVLGDEVVVETDAPLLWTIEMALRDVECESRFEDSCASMRP